MSLPTKQKAWSYNVGIDCSESTMNLTGKHAWWELKVALASFGSWAVVASSDGLTVKNIGDGSPDLWTAWTLLVGANHGTPHSWVILENSVTGGQLCLDMNHTLFLYPEIIYSATGAFDTDGTTSNRPTDTESLMLYDGKYLVGNSSAGAIVNVMCSTDGKITRVYVHCRDGAGVGGTFIGLEDIANPPDMWLGEIHQCVLSTYTDIFVSTGVALQDPRMEHFDTSTNKNMMYQVGAGPYEGWNGAFITTEGYYAIYSTGHGISEVDTDLEWNEGRPIVPLGLFRDVVTRGGGMGRFQDLYAPPRLHRSQTTYPADGSNQWVKWGGFLVPWNGSTPVEVL